MKLKSVVTHGLLVVVVLVTAAFTLDQHYKLESEQTQRLALEEILDSWVADYNEQFMERQAAEAKATFLEARVDEVKQELDAFKRQDRFEYRQLQRELRADEEWRIAVASLARQVRQAYRDGVDIATLEAMVGQYAAEVYAEPSYYTWTYELIPDELLGTVQWRGDTYVLIPISYDGLPAIHVVRAR